MIQVYAMKKPGVAPISFLVKNNNEYTMYQFGIKLNKWGDSSDISVKSIKCDSTEYIQDSTIIKYYSIGNVFLSKCIIITRATSTAQFLAMIIR